MDVDASKRREAACKSKASSTRAATRAERERENNRRRRLRALSARSRARELEAKKKAASVRAEARACREAEKERRREIRATQRARARRRREDSAAGVSSTTRAAEKRQEALNEARYHFEKTAPELVPLFDEEAHRFRGTGNQIREQFQEWIESWGQKEYAYWINEQIDAGARELERQEREHYARELEAVPF